jgi:hypothetical protein
MTSEMSPANRDERRGAALELYQTRNLVSAELKAVERDWSSMLQTSLSGDGWYRALGYLVYGFIGFLILSIAMAVPALDSEHSHLPIQLAIALAGTIACWIAADFRARNIQRRLYWDRYREGDRYLLDERGVQITSPMARHAIFWDGITNMADNGQRLVILIGKSGALFLVHAAFTGQDAKGFCAELMRRWQAHRASSQPDPAT